MALSCLEAFSVLSSLAATRGASQRDPDTEHVEQEDGKGVLP